MKTHHQSVYQQFDEQATSYLTSAVHANGEDLHALQKYLINCETAKVLDLGSGAGHVSFTVADKVESVIAFDLSDAMLEVVATTAKERGLNNISTIKGNVESLPFESHSFDLIISRYSAHHWHDVEQALREVRRVLKPGGRVIFIDVVSPGHPIFDLYLQTVEVLRDTSHVRDYPASEWSNMFNNARLFLKNIESFRLRLEFTSQVERMRTPKVLVDAIRAYQATLSGDIKAYFEIDEHGSFTSDVMLFELYKQKIGIKNMKEITIQKVEPNDVTQLQAISKQTFFATFSDSASADDMAHYLEEGFSLEKLTIELNNRDSEFYFVKQDNQVIGYLKLNFELSQTEHQDSKAMEIERIYVLEEFHGKKIGLKLYNQALKIALQRNIDYIWLGVWENNIKALNFYKQQGFFEFDQHIFKLGNDKQTDLLMKLELNKQ